VVSAKALPGQLVLISIHRHDALQLQPSDVMLVFHGFSMVFQVIFVVLHITPSWF